MASDAILDKSPLLPGENITYIVNGTSQDFIDQSDYQDSGGNQTHGTVDRYLWMYASPFTFLVGIVGNMFIILVSQIGRNIIKVRGLIKLLRLSTSL